MPTSICHCYRENVTKLASPTGPLSRKPLKGMSKHYASGMGFKDNSLYNYDAFMVNDVSTI